MEDLGRMAIDTVMRVAHNLRRSGERRPLSVEECAVMTGDLRLRDAGWNWGPDGPIAPPALQPPPAAVPG